MEWVHSILLVHILRYADAKNDPSITITLYIGMILEAVLQKRFFLPKLKLIFEAF